MWKQFISAYLIFPKKQRIGIFALLFLILLFMALPFFYPYFIKHKTYDHSEFEKSIAALEIKKADENSLGDDGNIEQGRYQKNNNAYNTSYNPSIKGALFYFDPNTATAEDWKKLGIRDKTIKTIQNYVSKGGKFYKKEDIGKIWGLRPDEVERLTPYVQIKGNKNEYNVSEKSYDKKEYNKREITAIDINSADTAALIALPGIGSKLSQRILNFRDKLGGFYKVEQIGETFGLPDSTFQRIKDKLKTDGQGIRKININTAAIDDMKGHPYLRYALANAIVQYRLQHGSYASVDDIKKIMTVTDEIFAKVAPYLDVK